MIPQTPLQMYSGLDPKTINNTGDTEENGTTTCIEGNTHDVIRKKPLGTGNYDFYIH